MPGPFRILLLAHDSVDRATAVELLGSAGGEVRVTAVHDALSFATAFADGTTDLAVVADDLEWATPLDLLETLGGRYPDVTVVAWMDPGKFEGAAAVFRAGAFDVVARTPGSALALRDAVARARSRTVSAPLGEQPLWSLVDAAGVAAFRCAHDGTLLARGPALARLAGDAAARPGANLLAHLMPADRLAELLDELAAGEPATATDLSPDGENGPRLDLTALLRDDEVWGLLIDRTESLRLRQELHRQQALPSTGVEDLAIGLAHDLREPLRSLGIRLDAVETALPKSTSAAAREALEAARSHITRLDNQIRTRLTGEHDDVTSAAVPGTDESDCNDVFEQVRANLAAAITESAGIVTCDRLPIVAVPPAQMLQVLQNLVGNALRHRGEAAPVVHISARRDERRWVFTVRDNGPGIAPEHREAAFTTRWRGPDSSGTGVGLAVCRTIISNQGGRIWVDDAEGGGAAVCFTVPASRVKNGDSPVSLKVVPIP